MSSRRVNRRWLRVRAWPVQHLPLGLLTQPFQAFLAAIAILNGVPLLLSRDYQASSIEALLPAPIVILWGLELLVGGALTLGGLLTERWQVERTGLLLLGPAAVVYGVAILVVVGSGGGVAGSVTLAFGAACGIRAYMLRLARMLDQAVARETHLQEIAHAASQGEASV